ncbi:MAG: LUD domain-containing protein [Candidatus Micrarchaeia archaeon]
MEEEVVLKNNEEGRKALISTFENYSKKFYEFEKSYRIEELKEKARRIREKNIKNVFELLKRAKENFEKNRINFYFAKNGEEANRIILGLIGEEKEVIKSKSNVANEIFLKENLRKNGKQVLETDCGDFLVELCEEEASHPVLPAISIPLSRMKEKIKEKFGKELNTPEEIAHFVRDYLKEKSKNAKVGITGANFFTAEGSIVIVENEGNVSLSSMLEKHIVITSMDKICENLEEAIFLAKLQSLFATGSIASRITIISSPSNTGDIEEKKVYGMHASKEIHFVVIDNKRSELLKNGFEEALYCINCGRCLYYCPLFREILKDYGFGSFFGGIGIIKAIFIEGKEEIFEKSFLCSTCKHCEEVCPVKINIPGMLRKIRAFAVERGKGTKTNEEMVERIRKYGNPFGEVGEKIPEKLFCC